MTPDEAGQPHALAEAPLTRCRCCTCNGAGIDADGDTCRDCDGTGIDNHGV